MAKLSMKLKQQAEPKFSTRRYNRCKICGRPHAYLRDYGICRICFRELAHKGQIPRRAEGFLVICMVQPDRMPQPSGRLSHNYVPAACGGLSPASGNRSVPARPDTLPPIQALPVIL